MTLKSCINNAGYSISKKNIRVIVFSKSILSGICVYCKNLFFTITPKQTTCSPHCAHMHRSKGIFINCFNCGKPKWRNRFRQNRHRRTYCSKNCYRKHSVGKNHPAYTKDGFVDKSGYRVVTIDKNQVLQHRHFMEQHLGRKLNKFEVVHHRNGIRHDNRIENLELWTCPSQVAGQRVTDLLNFCVKYYPDNIKKMLTRIKQNP